MNTKLLYKITLLSFLVTFISNYAFSQTDTLVLSFEGALDKMNNDSYLLKSAEAEKQSFTYKRNVTRGLYMPRISLSANYMRFDQDIGLDISGLTDKIGGNSKLMPSKLVLQNEQFATVGLNMFWPIFTGGKIRSVNKMMDATINASIYKIDEAKEVLNTELVERYYGYRLAQRGVILYQEVYDAVLLHQHDAVKLEENGMIAKAQRLYADLALSNAKSDLQKSKNTLRTVKTALNNTIVNKSEIIATSELFLVKDIEPVEFFEESAMKNSPLLKQVDAKKEISKQFYSIEKSNYFPTVAIVGNKVLAQDQLADMFPNWFVGVNLNWNIFDGAARSYKVKSARATMHQVEFLEAKAKEDIKTMINKLYNEILSNIDELESLNTTYTFAQEYLRVTNKSFTEGFSTSKDVVDAQLTVNKVKIGRLKIMNDYVLNLAKLLQYSGKADMFLEYKSNLDREREEFKNTDEI